MTRTHELLNMSLALYQLSCPDPLSVVKGKTTGAHYAVLQVANDDNPRRLLGRGNCAFSVMYKQLCDSIFSARLFLTAALHEPIMRLLMEEEWFYDIDPSKVLLCLMLS